MSYQPTTPEPAKDEFTHAEVEANESIGWFAEDGLVKQTVAIGRETRTVGRLVEAKEPDEVQPPAGMTAERAQELRDQVDRAFATPASTANARRMGKTTNAAAKLIEEHNLPSPADEVCPRCKGQGGEDGISAAQCPDCLGTGRIAGTSTPDRSKEVTEIKGYKDYDVAEAQEKAARTAANYLDSKASVEYDKANRLSDLMEEYNREQEALDE